MISKGMYTSLPFWRPLRNPGVPLRDVVGLCLTSELSCAVHSILSSLVVTSIFSNDVSKRRHIAGDDYVIEVKGVLLISGVGVTGF